MLIFRFQEIRIDLPTRNSVLEEILFIEQILLTETP